MASKSAKLAGRKSGGAAGNLIPSFIAPPFVINDRITAHTISMSALLIEGGALGKTTSFEGGVHARDLGSIELAQRTQGGLDPAGSRRAVRARRGRREIRCG